MSNNEPVVQRCDHNCIPVRGGLRHLFRAGWVCVRCGEWGRAPLPRLCPDCKLGPCPPGEEECPWCVASWEQQKLDEAMYGAGYEDAAAEHGYRGVPWGEA